MKTGRRREIRGGQPSRPISTGYDAEALARDLGTIAAIRCNPRGSIAAYPESGKRGQGYAILKHPRPPEEEYPAAGGVRAVPTSDQPRHQQSD